METLKGSPFGPVFFTDRRANPVKAGLAVGWSLSRTRGKAVPRRAPLGQDLGLNRLCLGLQQLLAEFQAAEGMVKGTIGDH